MSNNCNNHQAISITISAPGKVILHGEHSAVFGKLAIAGSLGLRTRVKLVESQQRKIGIEMKAFNLSCSYNLDDVLVSLAKHPLPLLETASNFNIQHPELINHEIISKQIEEFVSTHPNNSGLNYYQKLSLTSIFYLFHSMTASVDAEIKPFDLIIETDLTVGAGTGSSASFCVCLAGLFYQYFRVHAVASKENLAKNGFKPCKIIVNDLKKFEKHELDLISDWAYSAEKIIHGKPSGIDNSVCTYGSLVAFSKSSGVEQLDIPLKFKILLVNTREPKDTKVMVKRTTSLRERYGDVIEAVFDALDAVAKDALECFKSLNKELLRISTIKEQKVAVEEIYNRLGELTDMNQNLLATLNASHPKLDQVCSVMKANGLHGKLTGAGGGGYAFALIPPYFDEITLLSLINQLVGEGFEALVTDLGGPGVAVDS